MSVSLSRLDAVFAPATGVFADFFGATISCAELFAKVQ
jgi:hypothetical protein